MSPLLTGPRYISCARNRYNAHYRITFAPSACRNLSNIALRTAPAIAFAVCFIVAAPPCCRGGVYVGVNRIPGH